jgi:hypothetical protein
LNDRSLDVEAGAVSVAMKPSRHSRTTSGGRP